MTQRIFPKVSKRILLFEAGIVWLFASFMLCRKGFIFLRELDALNVWVVIACVLGGIVFFRVMFLKISSKHIRRIHLLDEDARHIFAFFNIKGYIMMAGMISLGVILRKTGLIPVKPLSYFYFFMGTPLFLSGIRFIYYGLNIGSHVSDHKNQ